MTRSPVGRGSVASPDSLLFPRTPLLPDLHFPHVPFPDTPSSDFAYRDRSQQTARIIARQRLTVRAEDDLRSTGGTFKAGGDGTLVVPGERAAHAVVGILNKAGQSDTLAKGVSVIGPRTTYRQFAENIGAKFLDVTDESWTWAKNEKFLAGIVKRGDDVVFAGKFNKAKLDPNTVLAQEIKYLEQHGYKWTDDFSRLIKK